MKPFWPINEFLSSKEVESTAISRDLRKLRNDTLSNKSINDIIDELQTKANVPSFQTKICLISFFDLNRLAPWALKK